MSEAAIRVEGLVKTYGGAGGWLGRARAPVHAVRGVDLTVARGQTLAVVGESGSGKSTLARMLVGLVAPTAGRIEIEGRDGAALARQGPRAFAASVQYVFQDPVASLNPRKSVRDIFDVPLRLVAGIKGRGARLERMSALLGAVGMPAAALERYPHEFSGGQAQRIAIARALCAQARILVLDEPVSALDVSVQAQVLLLLEDLKREFALTYVFISHDLAVVEAVADRVAVMTKGRIVEENTADALFADPRHDYTRELIASAPRL